MLKAGDSCMGWKTNARAAGTTPHLFKAPGAHSDQEAAARAEMLVNVIPLVRIRGGAGITAASLPDPNQNLKRGGRRDTGDAVQGKKRIKSCALGL